jgi:serine/threonine protein kinase
VIKNAGYEGHKADIWSCGVILYYMLAGCKFPLLEYIDLPFDDESLPKLIDKIVLAQFEFPAQFPVGAKDLVVNILSPNPNKRLTIEQIKSHPWIQGGPVKEEDKHAYEYPGSKDLPDLNPDEYIPQK